MRVVALLSGGKDSCFNMMQCIAAGHDVVAIANLYPVGKGNTYVNIIKNNILEISIKKKI